MDATRGTVVEDLHKRTTVKALMGVDVLRIHRFARKTREYMRAYARVHGLFGWDSERDRLAGHDAVEKSFREKEGENTHRSINIGPQTTTPSRRRSINRVLSL